MVTELLSYIYPNYQLWVLYGYKKNCIQKFFSIFVNTNFVIVFVSGSSKWTYSQLKNSVQNVGRFYQDSIVWESILQNFFHVQIDILWRWTPQSHLQRKVYLAWSGSSHHRSPNVSNISNISSYSSLKILLVNSTLICWSNISLWHLKYISVYWCGNAIVLLIYLP